MNQLSERLREIRSAPIGPKVAAFFDYDGTLTDGRCVRPLSRDAIAGRTVGQVAESSNRRFKHTTAALMRPQMWKVVQAHREMGHRIVITSSCTGVEVEALARELDADHTLATALEVVDDAFTGAIRGRLLCGPAKAAAVRALAGEQDVDLSESFAYSGSDDDVPLLAAVGHPSAVCPKDGLRSEAARRSWTTLNFPKHREPTTLLAARTAAYYGSFVGGAALGAVLGALWRRPSAVASIGVPLGNDVGLALAGIEVKVVAGKEYLTAARPCVFVFNHQSKLDAGILFKLLRNGFTGIAKKEARTIPVIGRILASSGVVFIDRANTDKAIAQLSPAVAKLRDEGVSLALSPEGTRSATPRLGPFRKGAFHIAMQAAVPIVPIVIRNAGELMWRGAQLMHPGTIEVQVLPPVDTTGWKPETVAAHAEQIRDMFVHTLANWQEEP